MPFFFDPVLQLYIKDEPLLVSGRILQASKKIGITLTWNDEGYVNGLSHTQTKNLCNEIGSILLSVEDFMNLAKREPRVASHDFAEWLEDTFTLSKDGSCMLNALGEPIKIPHARPAWFQLEDVSSDGLPAKTSELPKPNLWKFWTLGHHGFTSAAVRSFVTSSGTCSLDLGVPCFATHANFMIRECYKIEPSISSTLMDDVWPVYESKTLGRDDNDIRRFLLSLDCSRLLAHEGRDEFLAEKDKERLVDLKGKKRLLESNYKDLRTIDQTTICHALSTQPIDSTTFVIGHANPDADSIVSSVFEATRRSLTYPDKSYAAWTGEIPSVVRHILGGEISECLLQTPKFEPYHELVLVDCHTLGDGSQHQIKSVVDHHIINKKFAYYVSMSHEVSWSSTVQIYIKLLGSGLDLDSQTARILSETTKLEAEPSLVSKMSQIDQLVIERLEALARTTSSYESLMTRLIDDATVTDPFMSDYKQASYGFAVIKSSRKAQYETRARKNNAENYLPLTVVKQVIYDVPRFDVVLLEEISLYFNDDFYDKGFRAAVLHITKAACQAFHGQALVSSEGTVIRITNAASQTPRLLLMPLIEQVVSEHLKFFFSAAVGGYVSCGFYTESEEVYGEPLAEPGPTTSISFDDAKEILAGQSNASFLSMRQWWRVYHERTALRDSRSVKSLRDKRYVELLDTIILGRANVIHGDGPGGQPIIIENARPALIRPEGIDMDTGFPNDLESPDTYGDPGLWRYWSPDRDENVATRGHIFLLDQTCIDLKIGRLEKTKQLTFRPVYRDVADLKYEIASDRGRWVDLNVFPRLFSIPK